MKHWTEPNGILLINIPTEWQYLNPAIDGKIEQPPYSFQPYENAVGCFQLSCYPLVEEAPKIAHANPHGVKELVWQESRMDDSEFCTHLFFGAFFDQALIGKYIYKSELEHTKEIQEQLILVKKSLNRIAIVPLNDRKLASDLNKFDLFTASLAASFDLLNNAIESTSYIEIITISSNQIDAYLRLSIVITKQLQKCSNDIDIKYLFQADDERGIMERRIFDDALKLNVIDEIIFKKLNYLYQFRNRVIHRYIISNIKTKDLAQIAMDYIETSEKIRLILRDLENKQSEQEFGVYGKKFRKSNISDSGIMKRMHAAVNDKHLLKRLERKIPQ